MRKNYSELDHYDKYIEGNTVKKQERVWEPQHWEEKRRQNRKKRALQREIERERKHSRAFTLIQTSLLVGAVGGLLLRTKNYLEIKSDTNQNNRKVASLEQQYKELAEQNDARETEIESSIDYDAIREYAMNNLGMSYPKKNQVLAYDGVESEYVRQNDEIPKE